MPAGVTIKCTGTSQKEQYTGSICSYEITFNNEVVASTNSIGILTYTTTSDGIVKISASGMNGVVTITSITNSYGQTYTLKSLPSPHETWTNDNFVSAEAHDGNRVIEESVINVPAGITIKCRAYEGGGENQRYLWRNSGF